MNVIPQRSNAFGTLSALPCAMPFDPKECRRHSARCRHLASEEHFFLPRGMFLDLAKRWELLAVERQTLESEEPPCGRRSEAQASQTLLRDRFSR